MKKKEKDKLFDNLPTCAAEFIKFVIKKMRYRKNVRAEVMAELAAHFEDELKECKTDQEKQQKAKQLITDFGDVKLLAVLLRRAKKRCRPLNLYLKLFLGTGIPYGLLMGALYSLKLGFLPGLIGGLFAGLLFGCFMTLILGLWHTLSVKRMGYAKSDDEAMGVHHIRNIELPLGYGRVFDLCIASLNVIKKCKIRKEERSEGNIEVKTGITWKSFGERISFNICEINDSKTQVKVSSRPAIRTAVVDFGRNLDNVEKIIGFLAGG